METLTRITALFVLLAGHQAYARGFFWDPGTAQAFERCREHKMAQFCLEPRSGCHKNQASPEVFRAATEECFPVWRLSCTLNQRRSSITGEHQIDFKINESSLSNRVSSGAFQCRESYGEKVTRLNQRFQCEQNSKDPSFRMLIPRNFPQIAKRKKSVRMILGQSKKKAEQWRCKVNL